MRLLKSVRQRTRRLLNFFRELNQNWIPGFDLSKPLFTQFSISGNNLLTKPVTKCGLGSFEVFPHEDNCAKYYQCTGSDTPIILECPYPRLFDVNTGKCLIYLAVKCGTRRELKDPCKLLNY